MNWIQLVKMNQIHLVWIRLKWSNSTDIAYSNSIGLKSIDIAEPIVPELNSAKQVVPILQKSYSIELVVKVFRECMLLLVWFLPKSHGPSSNSLYTHVLLK